MKQKITYKQFLYSLSYVYSPLLACFFPPIAGYLFYKCIKRLRNRKENILTFYDKLCIPIGMILNIIIFGYFIFVLIFILISFFTK